MKLNTNSNPYNICNINSKIFKKIIYKSQNINQFKITSKIYKQNLSWKIQRKNFNFTFNKILS